MAKENMINEGDSSSTLKPSMTRISSLLQYLNSGLYGKEEAIRLSLLSAIAGESIFFMGPPGTAKSMISRRIATAFSDIDENNYFEYLMNEFSTPDEICGPVSLKNLQEDKYIRLTQGYLPTAKIAFLDEIWKSGPAILNTLLTIINEKKFHNGENVEEVPLISLAAASNELPEKNRGLEALWDRFVIRVFVNPVENEDDFFKVVDSSSDQEQLDEKSILLKTCEVKNWQKQIDNIELSEQAKNVISAIRKELVIKNQDDAHKDDEQYYVSDRRWKKIVHILKTSAFLNNRQAVDLMDCSLIEYSIWNTDKQHKEVATILAPILKQNDITYETEIEDIEEQINKFAEYVEATFFVMQKESPKKYKMADCNLAYKIVNPQRIQSYKNTVITPEFICPTYKHPNYIQTGAYYDVNRNKIGGCDYYIADDSFKIDGNIVTWKDGYRKEKHSFEIEIGVREKNEKIFSKADIYESIKLKTDNEYYKKILGVIDSEIEKVKKIKSDNDKSYRENLFANREKYIDGLNLKLDEVIKALEDKKVDLDKVRERYAE